jgi:hypothetical protein
VIREKLSKALSNRKVANKMLMKLTSGVIFITVYFKKLDSFLMIITIIICETAKVVFAKDS